MKPFTLEWWLVWKEYTYNMLCDFDNLTDEITIGEKEVSEEQAYWAWDQWERYKLLHEWIRQRIINKYGEE